MSFRITDPSQLETLAPSVRAQLEGELEKVGDGRAKIIDTAEGQQRNRQREQEVGRALVKWIDTIVLPDGTRPGLYFAHVANAGIANGRIRGGIFHGQGVRPGWPDYILDLPLGGFHGFRLEIKHADGAKPDAEQLKILARLERVGYKCAVAWGIDEAKTATGAYLALGGYAP